MQYTSFYGIYFWLFGKGSLMWGVIPWQNVLCCTRTLYRIYGVLFWESKTYFYAQNKLFVCAVADVKDKSMPSWVGTL